MTARLPATRPAAPTRRAFAAFLATAPVLLVAPALTLGTTPAAAWGERLVGSGRSVTQTRALPAFTAVASRGSFDIAVRQGAASQVEISADDNLIDEIETVVEEGRDGPTLTLRVKPGRSIDWRSAVRITVTTPTLTGLAGAGSGDYSVGPLQTPKLRLALSGSGDARFTALQADEFTIGIAGSSDVRAEGQVQRLSVSIAGSGDVDLSALRADEASVSIAGSGDAKLQAHKTLKISIAGSGDVVYAGEAAVTSRVAGSGRIRKL